MDLTPTHILLKRKYGLDDSRVFRVLRYKDRLKVLSEVHSHDPRYSDLIDEVWNDPASVPSDSQFEKIDCEYQALPRRVKMKHRRFMPMLKMGTEIKRRIEIQKLLTDILTVRPRHPFTLSVNGYFIEHGDISEKQLETLRVISHDLQ